jgi:hypothetical protein
LKIDAQWHEDEAEYKEDWKYNEADDSGVRIVAGLEQEADKRDSRCRGQDDADAREPVDDAQTE